MGIQRRDTQYRPCFFNVGKNTLLLFIIFQAPPVTTESQEIMTPFMVYGFTCLEEDVCVK